MTVLAATPIFWRDVDPETAVGTRDGSAAGSIDHRGSRFIAIDQVGSVIGTFATEREARASLEPEALDRALARRAQRDNALSIVTAAASGATAMIALAGMQVILR